MSASEPTANSFTHHYGQIVRILTCDVGITGPYDPSKEAYKPHPKIEFFKGIIDTGASASAVSPAVVRKLNLKAIDLVQVNTAAGKCTTNKYLANIYMPNGIAFSRVSVTQADLAGGLDVLVGMDVLTRGDFTLSNYNGETVFSIRTPSCEKLEFSSNTTPYVRTSPKVGRNDPCSCGSGMKYKRCCGK